MTRPRASIEWTVSAATRLVRLRYVTDPSFEDMRVAFVVDHGAELAGSHWAHVVQAGASFGMAGMGGLLGAEKVMDYQIFTDVSEAERWLAGVP
jgi:hypothetical protein